MTMEGSSSGTKRSGPKDDDQFTDLVLSWSLKHIFDDNLYKYQVEKIPESFQSVDQYLGSYVYPLLEETRIELASAMETVYKAPFSEVISFRELKHNELLSEIKVDYWRNRRSDRGGEAYRTLPGDIVLLSDSKPETPDDLQRVGWTCTFASVVKIADDENGDSSTSSCFKVKTAKQIDVGDGLRKSLYVVFLSNMTTNKRIWNALHMRRNLNIIEKVLCNNDLGEENCEFCAPKCHNQIEEKFGPDLFSKLNESQKEAIQASLFKVECNHNSSVELIWGPPGTGKTTTVSILLCTLLKMKGRTLICAPTNVAITELASRVMALVKSSSRAESEKSFLSCFPLGEMLVFGSKNRLKVGADVEEICLDYRVDRLIECLVPSTGWKHCVVCMIDFLEDCVSQYNIYVDNERIKAKESLDDEINQKPELIKSILEFARDRFAHIATPLRESMLTFLTHLPQRFLLEQNFQSMMQLVSLLGSIEVLLFEDCSMTPQELESVFLQKGVIGSESVLDKLSLPYIRNQCLSVLRSLQYSLDNLSLPLVTSRFSIKDFCFQKASLVFCTTSSTYKLHSVDMEPFNLLVIDEAAQVKECETAIALQISDVRHAILVGDECQLPATVSSKVCQEAGFGRSLFERLTSLGHSKYLLNMQYRMHPSISWFPNSNFYLNQILDAPSVQSQSYEKCYLKGRMFGPYSFINIRGGKEELDEVGHTRRNMVEAAVVVKVVHKLFKAWNGSKEKLSIGLISPYAAQVVAIRDRIKQKYENHERFRVKVKSIDGFQGGEEDIIIISTVRSNRGGSIGFLSSPQRANVALTRARHCLWILGNEGTLSKSDSLWEALICDAKDRQCFFTADEDGDIAKTIVDVKKELQQHDDLLSGESILFKNARWKVLFSDNFRKSFRKLKPSHVKKLAINVLLKLASGWRPKKINVDCTCEISSYIVKQFKVEGYYVVCSIDITKDTVYEQVLKVWDILPLEEIPKLLKRLDSIYAMCTDEFISHSKEKCFEGNLEVPKTWSSSNEIIRFKELNNTKSSAGSSASAVENRSYVENSKVSESLLLMKFYSLSSGAVNYLLSDIDGREVDLPFEVTDEERKVILFARSSFILGRSGTGKTTILTMKLNQKLQQYSIASQGSILHQLFVTVSPKLCYAVKKHVSQLKSFASGNSAGKILTEMDDIDDMAEFKDIPDTFIGIQPEKYPLIITFHKFLMMLDGTLGISYFERFHEVKDSCRHEGNRSVALQTFIRKHEVTYDRFWSSYWPHFNAKLTKNLDPSRVFTEIMSHIKGGLRACDSKRSRQEYISLSDSRVSALSAEKREVIYDIFQDYEKMKLERGEFDLADFVFDIYIRLENESYFGDKMDFVYIDEVQDLNLRQISLFRYICKNVDEGFVFCGDTAQTIARGIDFRFEEIRSLFYNEFLMKSESCEFSGNREKGILSDTFKLSQNFRTHTGVLGLAQSVVDLLCHFFPHSVDVLAPETSLIYGESPVVLQPGSDENSILTIFGSSGNGGGKWVGFGADQVILVRDDSTRKEISNYIGHKALVLTILECKGLEFQDVLLYNFFGSSHMRSQWRVVYEFLKEKDLLDANSLKSFPSFSHSRHNILCSELKQLYVAITRTRQRLWIWENNEELSKPMFEYWKRLCLVQVGKMDDFLADAMQRTSSPEEWKSQGIKLFWEKHYEMASMCFEKAGEETWDKRAKASGLRAAADSLRGSNAEEARIMLREAANIFDSIGKSETAAECFCDLGDYERAGKIYLEKCGTSGLRKAGECFSLAGSYEIAAQVYAKGNIFKECLEACIKGKCFDMGMQYIQHWKQQASSSSGIMTSSSGIMMTFKDVDKIEQEFLEQCAMKCYNTKNKTSLMKFVRAFHTMESKRNFLKSLDYLEELLLLEEESGNFIEAAEIAKSLGNIVLEVDLLGKAEKFANASLLIRSHVLSNSLWVSGSQGWPLKSFPEKEELLTKAVSFAHKVSSSFHASICSEAKILSHKKRNLSELVQSYNASKQYKTYMGEILSVRKLLDVHFQVHPANYEWEHELHSDPKLSDERISRNQVSALTLICIWNLWKAKNLEILGCLNSIERQDFIKSEGAIGFCFSFFGVRLSHNLSSTYLLMNPNAAWVKNVDKRFIVWKKKVATLDARHFASAARKYWSQEFNFVGLRVLEALSALNERSAFKLLSKYCQSIFLTWIFDIAKFFIESKSLEDIKKAEYKLQNFMELSTNRYFEIVFPLDPRQSLSENMISLRETEISYSILEKVISRNISTENELTYGQIGRVKMILLGCSKPKYELHDKIAENKLIEIFTWIMDLNMFYMALEDAYNANWRVEDYISPNCFLYLVERLLILVSHSNGLFFTTKSSYVEYLVSLQSDSNPRDSLVTDNRSQGSIFDFFVRMVRQFLSNIPDTVEWIKNSNIDCKYYFPVLVLRLFVILCLVCLNSELPFNILFELLSVPQIKCQLPREFCEAIFRSRKKNDNYSFVAEAFKVIGDPLVIVATSENKLKIVCPDAIFLDLVSFSCKNEIMKILFPRSATVEENSSNQGESTNEQSSKTASETDSKLSFEDGNNGSSSNGLIVSFGEMLIDFVPTVSGVSLTEAPGFLKAPGGSPANVAIAVTRLGGKAAFLGKLGDDEFGHMLAGILKENGVSADGVNFDNGARTALAFVTLRADGEREFMFYGNPSAAKVFHYGSISLIVEPCRSAHLTAMEVAKQGGALLSYDPNLRLHLWPNAEFARQQIMTIWDKADVIKISDVELQFLIGGDRIDDAAARSLWHPTLKLLLVTLGEKGCRYYAKNFQGGVDSYPVKAVDTTGAGDSFVGALLCKIVDDHSIIEDESRLKEVLKYACACGAITTTKKGAIPALPKHSEVLTLINGSQ
ncbi:hypothetical protein BUALT_Bualt14G0021500 [Buddleja alternifolia]|uniref:fructokinase n=1 Tax=Buddleja alternifolia TaxID=168488 RepID=A0AAV6WNS6_9LAMI|nr:hypothetical protein BUALT_Bualt14G0021500 [Buddleja alternifolia]